MAVNLLQEKPSSVMQSETVITISRPTLTPQTFSGITMTNLALPPRPKQNGGKRGPSGPIVVTSSSDDDESDSCIKDSTSQRTMIPLLRNTCRSSSYSVNSNSSGSYSSGSSASTGPTPTSPVSPDDYENVSSPGNSSTASEPIYVRQPGFSQHAHEVTRERVKKKKTAAELFALKESIKTKEPLPPRLKQKKDALPMRLRALPQSFWQQPNIPQHVSPAIALPTLPPLSTKGTDEDVSEMRPVTPPEERETVKKCSTPKAKFPERKITVANTDLLFKLFDGVTAERGLNRKTGLQNCYRRGRPRKFQVATNNNKVLVSGDDPYLVDDVANKYFPQLSLEHSRQVYSGNANLQLITIKEGDKSVLLPALCIDQNYPQLLSELVMHI